MEDFKKHLPFFLRVGRSLALYFSYLAIKGLAGLCARGATVAVVLLSLFIFHSTVRVFGETDRHIGTLALAFREKAGEHGQKTGAIFRLILTDKMLRIELVTLLLILLVLPVEAGYAAFATLLFQNTAEVPRILVKAAVLGVVLPLFFGLWLLSHYFSFLWWGHEKKAYKEEHPWRALALKLLIITVIYVLGGLLIVYFLEIVASVFNILRAAAEVRWWLPVALIASIFLLVFLTRFLRALRIRRNFFKRLKRLCRELGIALSPIKRPYRSLLRLGDEVNFTLRHGEKTYSCKLFGTLNRRNPLYFSERGIVQCLHSFRFRRIEYFRYTTQFDFSFDAEGTRVLIVNPVSKEIFAGHTAYFRPIDTGEAVGAYKIFTATGFLGALSRDVVDR